MGLFVSHECKNSRFNKSDSGAKTSYSVNGRQVKFLNGRIQINLLGVITAFRKKWSISLVVYNTGSYSIQPLLHSRKLKVSEIKIGEEKLWAHE